jgi:hypothetical protein
MARAISGVERLEDGIYDRVNVVALRRSLATNIHRLSELLSDARFELRMLEEGSERLLDRGGLASAIAHTRRVLALIERARKEHAEATARSVEATACASRLTRSRLEAVGLAGSRPRAPRSEVRLRRGERVWLASSERVTFSSPDLDCAACDALSLAELEGADHVSLDPDVPPDALERGFRLRLSLEALGA